MKPIPLPVHKLAADLGLKASSNPIAAILAYCDQKVGGFLQEMDRCDSLAELLNWVEARVGTKFCNIQTEGDLQSIVAKYVARGEKIFAGLQAELTAEVYGITYRLQNAEAIAPPYVSIIDCRGEKSARAYFTKWHEIAHLLTLTDQQRLRFTRSHSKHDKKDPEERLMDIIAGKFGFYDRIFHKMVSDNISFSELERVRQVLCPEASLQSSLISFIKYWPAPCIFLRANVALNRKEQLDAGQGAFDFFDAPIPVLRGVEVSVNDLAREGGFQLFPNMRIPESSIVHTVFRNGGGSANSIEDFHEWNNRSSGEVNVEARFRNGVEVLITPR